MLFARFGVSRTLVREMLVAAEREGLVPNGLFSRMFQLVYRVPKIDDVLEMDQDCGSPRGYNDEHRRILDVIVRRQGSRVEFLVREHLQGSYDLISRRIGEMEVALPRVV